MSYMDKLEEVALGVACRAKDMDTLGRDIMDTWSTFERQAREHDYDLFNTTVPPSQMRRLAFIICGLLYQVPGADCALDVAHLRVKNEEYGGSWIKRGGPGAFFMLARKWDRISLQLDRNGLRLGLVLESDGRVEGVLDDIGDLRRYLLLCLSYWEELDNPTRSASGD